MTDTPSAWRVACARLVAAGVIIALAPLPLAAAEANLPAPPSINIKAAVQKFAAAERAASNRTAPAQTAQPAAAPQSPSFFRTPLGLAVIAVVGAGSAFAVYSAQHDRIHSATR